MFSNWLKTSGRELFSESKCRSTSRWRANGSLEFPFIFRSIRTVHAGRFAGKLANASQEWYATGKLNVNIVRLRLAWRRLITRVLAIMVFSAAARPKLLSQQCVVGVPYGAKAIDLRCEQ